MSKTLKGSITPLNVTKEAQHRVFAGLGWDPNFENGFLHNLRNLLKGKKRYHDLDLACYAYDANYNLIEVVSADTREAANQSGRIYHSGDNIEGIGDGDDEQISAELKDLDEYIVHLLFTAQIKSGHAFSEITDPAIRLVDGYSTRVFIEQNLESVERSGYAFVHLFWQHEGWQMRFIDEYFDPPKNKEELNTFLKGLIERV